MHSTIDAASVVVFHDRQLRNPDWPIFDDAQSGAWTWIAAGKRLIDRHNQKRNDAVEALDERLPAEARAGPANLSLAEQRHQ